MLQPPADEVQKGQRGREGHARAPSGLGHAHTSVRTGASGHRCAFRAPTLLHADNARQCCAGELVNFTGLLDRNRRATWAGSDGNGPDSSSARNRDAPPDSAIHGNVLVTVKYCVDKAREATRTAAEAWAIVTMPSAETGVPSSPRHVHLRSVRGRLPPGHQGHQHPHQRTWHVHQRLR